MDRSTITTRRAFLARLPHLAAGGALVLITIGAMVRGGRNQGDFCQPTAICRTCGAYRGCDLPRARAARAVDPKAENAEADGAQSRTEVADG
ncbi:MAG: hypothetical protein JJU36_04220 [Phycisphaeraceae bacterium]|nr:hypothetical protein [Phycisphaeraceae bacterium]